MITFFPKHPSSAFALYNFGNPRFLLSICLFRFNGSINQSCGFRFLRLLHRFCTDVGHFFVCKPQSPHRIHRVLGEFLCARLCMVFLLCVRFCSSFSVLFSQVYLAVVCFSMMECFELDGDYAVKNLDTQVSKLDSPEANSEQIGADKEKEKDKAAAEPTSASISISATSKSPEPAATAAIAQSDVTIDVQSQSQSAAGQPQAVPHVHLRISHLLKPEVFNTYRSRAEHAATAIHWHTDSGLSHRPVHVRLH